MLKFVLTVEYTLELHELTGRRPLSGGTSRSVDFFLPLLTSCALEPSAADGDVGEDRSLTAALTALLSGTARSCSAFLSAAAFESGVGSSAICSSEPVPPRTQLPHLSAT